MEKLLLHLNLEKGLLFHLRGENRIDLIFLKNVNHTGVSFWIISCFLVRHKAVAEGTEKVVAPGFVFFTEHGHVKRIVYHW